MNSLFVTSLSESMAKSSFAKAILEQIGEKSSVLYKPVVSCTTCGSCKESCESSFTFDEVSQLLAGGEKDFVVNKVLADYSALSKKYDFVVCEGTDYKTLGKFVEFDLMTSIISNIDVPVVVVLDEDKNKKSCNVTASTLSIITSAGCRVAAVVGCGSESISCSDKIVKYTSCVKPLPTVAAGEVTKEIVDIVLAMEPSKVTPGMFELELLNRAAANKQTIVLPEGTEPRILEAADELLKKEICNIVLIGNETEVKDAIESAGLECPGIDIVDPLTDSRKEAYAQELAELRKKKGMTYEDACETLKDETYYATMMVYKGDASGMVSGAIHSTANTVRPALQIIKTKPGASIVSSVFFMCLAEKVWVFGDCAVNPKPTPEQLAEIAISSAETAKQFGVDPVVAFLSYSSGSSGTGEDVEKVIKAVSVARATAPDVILDGPLQFDAASTPSVAETKVPDSKVAGKANVFVFPDLNAGNNCYKAVQRTADAVAVGPVLQGLKKPVNDLSRGCKVPDVINTIAITAIQAQG
ncbi:MAG: phosphate acetyltransferase [Kiritimatiellae bacterium]|jgi:phosphate acetyltransferase|nr:phosphate acetyltransferase [Kiritimatiellia bacterium]